MKESPKGLKIKKVPLTNIRKIIRDKMIESSKVPQFCLEMEIKMDKILSSRNEIKPEPSITSYLIWVVAKALEKKPKLNGFFYGDEIGYVSEINIGVAVAIPGGLLVPVIREANKKKVRRINNELSEFLERIKNKKLSPDCLEGGTFTISNLGMYKIKGFIPLLNVPQIAILGVGGITQRADFFKGIITPHYYSQVTLVADHRALDGATAADFLSTFKRICEEELNKGVL